MGRALPLLLALLTVSGLAACGSADPPSWDKIKCGGAAERTAAPRTSNHLVVYLDTSGSMAGYVSPDGKINFANAPDGYTAFSRTLQELRNVVTTITPPADVVFRRVDSKVELPSLSDLELGQLSIKRAEFNGGETNLAGAIDQFSKPIQIGPRRDETVDAEDLPARFHILVTDGVQSTKQQRTDVSCVAGSDYVCVRKAVLALLEKGWAGTVIGLRSEFHGKIYSEISPGQSIQYDSRRSDPKTYRPFYLYIFSPDHEALERLVDALKTQLRATLGQQDVLREYALTPSYIDSVGSAELVIPKDSADALEQTRSPGAAQPPRLTLRVDVDAEREGEKPFLFAVDVRWSGHGRDGATPPELSSMLRWELAEVSAGGEDARDGMRYPEVRLVSAPTPDEKGRIVLQAAVRWPRSTGTPGWKVYCLRGRLDLDRQAPPWVQQWSTNMDTTAEVANKTLNLTTALANLWRNPTMEKQPFAEVHLRVGPQ